MVSSNMAIQRTNLHVPLTPELGRFVTARVASGRYQTASEVVRAGLRLLEQSELQNNTPARRRTAVHHRREPA